MSVRTTKIFVNDSDTQIGNSTKLKGTLSGYIHVEMVPDSFFPNNVITQQFRITTTTPSVEVLGDWDDMYEGAVKSYKKYYTNNFENVKVKTGNIIRERSKDFRIERDEVVACWVAAYDDDIIAFQVHYPNGSIQQATTDDMEVNEREQRETQNLPLKNTTREASVSMSVRKEEKTSRRANSKLSFADEEVIIELLKVGQKQKFIAQQFDVSPQYIGKLKKTLIAEGRL